VLRRQFRHLLSIANKQRSTVPFDLNEHQLSFLGRSSTRDIILKSRQMGFSTAILGEKFLKCASVPNTRAVVISHDNKSTETLFGHVHFFQKYCNIPIRTGTLSRHEISFPDTDSTFYIGTAGARVFGRGDTITDLHCSEYAFWPDPERVVTGLFQAVPSTGSIILESTANGQGNSFHRRCVAAHEERSRWRLHFYPWYIATEYQLPVDDDFDLYDEEMEYAQRVQIQTGVRLSLAQLAWRRFKVEEFETDPVLGITPQRLFDQEYPFSFDSAFLSTGTSVFSGLGLAPSPPPPQAPQPCDLPPTLFARYSPPQRHSLYVVGIDPAEGVYRDESVMEVVSATPPYEQVAEWASSSIEPDKLVDYIIRIARMYNDAMVVVERNNHGHTVLSHLKRRYPMSYIFSERKLGRREFRESEQDMLGIRTGSNKTKMVDDLYTVLRDGFVYYSPKLHSELMSFVEKRTAAGNVQLCAAEGCMDNRVMAMVMAVQGLIYYRRTLPMEKQVLPPNCFKAIMERRRKRRTSLRQHLESISEY